MVHFACSSATFNFKFICMVGTLLLLFLVSNSSVHAQACTAGPCLACVAGLYWNGNICDRCQGGKVSLSMGATSCENCTTGKHSYGIGAGETCRNCTLGKHQSEHGVAYCNKCQAGRYINEIAAATCDSCPPGRYQEEVGQTECVNCPKGFHSWNELISEKDASSCEGCIPGMYGETDGSVDITDCKNCSAGRYSIHVGYPTFKSYPLGYTANLPCAPCTFGKWSSEQGMPNLIGCISCKIGYYNEKEGSNSISSCKICAGGRYMTNFGSYNSNDCNICVSFLLSPPIITFSCCSVPPNSHTCYFFYSQKVTVKIKRGKVTAYRALPDGTRQKKVQKHAQSVLLEGMNLIPNPFQMNV